MRWFVLSVIGAIIVAAVWASAAHAKVVRGKCIGLTADNQSVALYQKCRMRKPSVTAPIADKEETRHGISERYGSGWGSGHRPGGHRPSGWGGHRPGGWGGYHHGPNWGNVAGGLIIGNAISNWLFPPKPDVVVVQQPTPEIVPGTPAWYAYCANKYRSFDAATGTYLGFDGQRHGCQ